MIVEMPPEAKEAQSYAPRFKNAASKPMHPDV
jgi:hypothetical protein